MWVVPLDARNLQKISIVLDVNCLFCLLFLFFLRSTKEKMSEENTKESMKTVFQLCARRGRGSTQLVYITQVSL